MHGRSPWIRIVPFFFAPLLGLTACAVTARPSHDAADSGTDSAPEAGPVDAGANGFLTPCTVLGMPGDCPPGENLTCRSYPNPAPGRNLCTRPCTPATVAVDCPPPSKGCGGMGLCAAGP